MEYHAGKLLIEREIQAKLTSIGNRLALTLRRSVYEFDRESVRDVLLAEFPEEGLEAAAAWTRNRQRLLAGLSRGEGGRIVDIQALPQGSSFVEMKMPLHLSASGTPAGQLIVGEVALVFDQRYMHQQLLKKITVRQGKNILMILLFLLILGEVVRRALVRPLENLRRAMLQAETVAFGVNEERAVFSGETQRYGFAEVRQMHETFGRLVETIAYRQRALSIGEQRYRELVENVDALFLKLDADLCCLFVNQTTERMFESPAASCIGRSFLDFIHPDERESTRRTLEEWVAAKDASVEIENRLLRATGESPHVSWAFGVVCDYSGDPVYFRAIGRDVTTQKKTEQALRDSEQRFRRLSQEFEAVLEGIADSLVLFNSRLEVVWANRGAVEQFGCSQEELRGRTCHQLWVGDCTEVCAECLRAVFASGQPFEGVRTGAYGRTWGVKGFPVRDSAGKISNVIQIASDLTEKMQLREEATRAAHLAALGSLSAGVAHEINNPTGLILMSVPVVQEVFADLLAYLDELPGEHASMRFGGLPYAMVREEVPQSLLDILGGAQRIRAIVEELKNFARMEAQGTQEVVDLGEVVSGALRLLGNLLKNSTQFLVVDIPDDLPKVSGSSQRLEQVVVNLLQNACHALTDPAQAIEIRVFADRVRRRVTLKVRDEGTGIPAGIMEKITDPFFTTRRESGGTGLGLSVSARIIAEHQGMMKIESEPGRGATFTLEFPALMEDGNGD